MCHLVIKYCQPYQKVKYSKCSKILVFRAEIHTKYLSEYQTGKTMMQSDLGLCCLYGPFGQLAFKIKFGSFTTDLLKSEDWYF